MIIVHRFHIEPTKEQEQKLFQTLALYRRLYNAALEQREICYRQRHKSPSCTTQKNELPELKKELPEYKQVNAQVLQDCLQRLDNAFQRFFSGLAGYPRYKDRNHYRSFTYPQADKQNHFKSALPERERDYIILHEQYHICRLDHIVKILAFLALCAHWFNPLVWLAFVLSGKDMEMLCDEAVMKKMDGDIRADYSASLLSLATGKKIIAVTPLAFGEGNTKERIKNIMNYKKPTFWIIILALVVCVAAAIFLLSDPKGNDSGTTNASNSTLSSSPSPSQNASPSAPETPAPKGETKRYTYQNLVIELTNVKSDRTEAMTDDGGNKWQYTVITFYPGAKLTVIKADMSDPTYSTDGEAHPQWGILMGADTTEQRIKITDDIQPLDITSDMGGIYNLEASLYVFKFEVYSE